MQYKGYTVEDFVMDSFFQEWVQNPTEQADVFWENWLIKNPSQAETIAEARALIKSMAFEHKTMPADKAERMWHNLEKLVSAKPERQQVIKPYAGTLKRRSSRRHLFMGIAASLAAILLLSVAGLLYRKWVHTITYTTAYGETKAVQLPDGSLITLNANSQVSFAKNWSATDVREVWLSGEAFFSVVHTANHQRFIVHTDNSLQVEVLGTEFNITKRNNKTRVVLETGQIQLRIQPADKKDAPKQRLLMKPGELIEFDEASEKYIKKEVNPKIYSSWKSNKLQLDDTSLEEIVQLLENSYGYQVKVTRKDLLKQKVSGSIPLSNKDTLLQYIAQTFEIKISRKGSLVQILPMKQ
ncbi:FecR domain-containing protein [Rhodocytophaga aerolata]|uniref:FecR domain-containing protein n=1 Tax=Rhodocytophaga aerolata TaxID=455078 RepID=A0ABT8R105_9BACT|nr:FecR domain-containing protein [Rhodocytophaga aerolata]MDO1444998.1 FecR domain-containing protein [Rhodocytophaga aerolata]